MVLFIHRVICFTNMLSIISGEINVPAPTPLPGTDGPPLKYILVADEAFPLKDNMLRLFPGRDLDSIEKKRFNFRLSRAHRVVENAFGELKLEKGHALVNFLL